MWLRLCTIRLLWNLKVFPQNSQALDFMGVLGCWGSGVGVDWEPEGDCMDGSGGVERKGGLAPAWNGCRSLCMGLGRLGERGGLDPEVLPASSLSLREKSIAGGSRGMGLSRSTLSKALGW